MRKIVAALVLFGLGLGSVAVGALRLNAGYNELNFAAVKTAGVEEVEGLDLFFRHTPPLKIGDVLLYQDAKFIVTQSRITLLSSPPVYIEISAKAGAQGYAQAAQKMNGVPSTYRVDEQAKVLVPVAEDN